MPIYEYECPFCKTVFQRWSSQVRDGEYTEICPKCGATAKRIISQTNFRLKGRGWAKDGYSDPKTNTGSDTSSDPPS